jgi:hypothetical protein
MGSRMPSESLGRVNLRLNDRLRIQIYFVRMFDVD